jgi:predicted PurR-regulated permease PerM
MAVAGMVLGIIGIVFSFIPVIGVFFGSILGLLALILGGVGLSRAKDPSRGGRGQAITGIVLGILALVMVILQVAVIGEAADEFNKELERQQQEQNG